MHCSQLYLLLFLLTTIRTCVSHPLGQRVAAVAKQFKSHENIKIEDYDYDDEFENNFDDDEINDGLDDSTNDAILDGSDNLDQVNDDYDEGNNLGSGANAKSDDNVGNIFDNDDDDNADESELNDTNGIRSAYTAPTGISSYSDDNEDATPVYGYRPDVALTSPFD